MAAPDMQLSADALLQASRRLDWRFLLPDPDLNQVAYIGPAQGTLLESLKLFSTSLTVVETGSSVSSGQHDVVVVGHPTAAALCQAVQMVRSGGWLYVEAHNPFACRGLKRRFRWPRFAHDYMGVLHQLGMDQIEAYWHWPDFESCTKIIPLHDRAALLHVFAPRWAGVGELLKSALGHGLLESGLLALIASHFSIVAHCK